MSSKGQVFYNSVLAGTLEYREHEYVFEYDTAYAANSGLPSISLSLPKSGRIHRSGELFPFFSGLLAEGTDKVLQCALLKIDENDAFSRLLKTAGENTIGAITVREAL